MVLMQTAGCGTIFHPGRIGQTGGKLDIGIVALDGLGLFFFLIPGIIAFAIDFSNGTIYLPPGSAQLSPAADGPVMVRVNPGELSPARIEQIVREHTGCEIRLDRPDVQVIELQDQASQAIGDILS
ncbi:MAG TPA: hypothetical protein DCM68_07915 [Verrucomicrobia bacterium]|nr:hypothetical protein [Verrucomicrobiota bacterium]